MTDTLATHGFETLDFTRQREWFDPETTNSSATLVGCGGIGSFTALALAKLGVKNIKLLDFDEVEHHNVPNQLFVPEHVGVSKIEAVGAQIEPFGCSVELHNGKIEDGVPLSDVVFACVDSMQARNELWATCKLNPRVKLLVDGRLAGQKIVLYTANPMELEDVKGYESTLYYSDAEAERDSCTARSIIDVGFTVGALNANMMRKYYAGTPTPKIMQVNMDTLTMLKSEEWL